MPDQLSVMVYCCSLPGAAGGLCIFLISLKRGHYKNNRYLAKLSVELLGALVTATALASMWQTSGYQQAAAFAIGITWTSIVQILRQKITKIVEAALGEALGKPN